MIRVQCFCLNARPRVWLMELCLLYHVLDCHKHLPHYCHKYLQPERLLDLPVASSANVKASRDSGGLPQANPVHSAQATTEVRSGQAAVPVVILHQGNQECVKLCRYLPAFLL